MSKGFSKIIIFAAFLFFSGCQTIDPPPPPASFSDSSILITKIDNLSDEVKGTDVEITAGEKVNLGLKISFSDETQQLLPVQNVTWSISSPNLDLSSFSIRSTTILSHCFVSHQ